MSRSGNRRAASRVLALFVLVLTLCGAISAALAVLPSERLADPALGARALSQELRCLVCQSESINDSSADLAHDLRVLVRERITVGDTDEQVLAYLTSRYGDYVLLRPPVKPTTWLLWFGTPGLLVFGGLALAVLQRRGRRAAGLTPLSAAERVRLDRLLEEETE